MGGASSFKCEKWRIPVISVAVRDRPRLNFPVKIPSHRQLSLALTHPSLRPFARDPTKPVLGKERRMGESVKELKAEFVDLLRKQVEALELDTYVGLTDEERSKYYKRQERIRDLDARMNESSDRVA